MTLRSGSCLLLLVLLASPPLHAQKTPRILPTTVPVEGTPYLEDTYAKGVVYRKDQTNRIDLRYNIYEDQLEFKQTGQVEALSPNMPILKIVMGKNTFVPDVYPLKGKPTYGFFIRLDSGKIGILQKLNTVISPYVPAAPFQDAKPAAYERKSDTWYLKVGTQPVVEFKNIKKLIQSLPDHQKEMEDFVKREKVSANKPEELVRFSQYYNSLP